MPASLLLNVFKVLKRLAGNEGLTLPGSLNTGGFPSHPSQPQLALLFKQVHFFKLLLGLPEILGVQLKTSLELSRRWSAAPRRGPSPGERREPVTC